MKRIELQTRVSKYNRLAYLSEEKPKRNRRHCLWICDCGKKKTIALDNVRGGRVKNCGACYNCEEITQNSVKCLFNYNRETGELTSKIARHHKIGENIGR